MSLNVTTENKEGADILHLQGKLDAAGIEPFGAALLPIAENPEKKWAVIDFDGVDYIVSAGLRVVLQAVKAMKPRGAALYVTGMKPLVHDIFKTMGFFAFVTRCDSIDACLEEIGKKA